MKPDINGLGVCAELTLHEKALREAQNEISALKAQCARLREELRRAYEPQLGLHQSELQSALARQKEQASPLLAQSMNFPPISGGTIPHGLGEEIIGRTHQFPPHHSTVGLGMDGEGRVEG